ncbi:MAG: ADP-ribosylglycohydrolase family protein [Actinomycetota bacterium]
MDLEERILGSIYGHLAGDALGVPYEFTPPGSLPARIDWTCGGAHGRPPGTWSDDGALMLCLLASLLESGGFDPNDAGGRFVRWFDEGYMSAGGDTFDWGRGTARAIQRLRSGIDPLQAGPGGENDNGNGSLMRILPVALWTSGEPGAGRVSLSHEASGLTHGHPRSRVCCALYVLTAGSLLAGKAPGVAWDGALTTLRGIYRDERSWGAVYLDELDRVLAFGPPRGTGYVVDCLASSIAALESADDYTSSGVAAVRFGNDTDTTAAVAGGLAGALYGVGSIPAEWREGLRLTDEQRRVIDRFAEQCAARSADVHEA